jgi:hypothetical protein
MRFNSLSEAIEYYSYAPDPLESAPPFSDLTAQVSNIPTNTNYLTPAAPDVVIYGKTIWGFGVISGVTNPKI